MCAGSFLVIPAGISQQDAEATNTTYVYARGHWKAPVAHLPALDAPTVAVRFCPHLFKLRHGARSNEAAGPGERGSSPDTRGPASSAHGASAQPATTVAIAEPRRDPAPSGAEEGSDAAWTALQYRMLFAVATTDSVIVYDTQVCGTCCRAESGCASQMEIKLRLRAL